MAFADALAQGILKGVGTGVQQHYLDQQRKRQEDRKLQKSFDMYKKQTQYSYAMEGISKQNEALGAWESAAKLSVDDLAYQAATKMSANFSKEDRPKFFRDAMKRLNGMSKVELLSRAGYNKPDYSQWANNPEYADAIPQSRIAGMADSQGMSDVFKYVPPQTTDTGTKTEDKKQWQVEMEGRHNAYSQSLLGNSYLIQQGIEGIDPSVLNLVDASLQFGKQDPIYVDSETGIEVNRIDDEVIRGLQNGKFAIVGGTVMPMRKAQGFLELENEFQQEAVAAEQPTETPMEGEVPLTDAVGQTEGLPMDTPPLTSQEQVRQQKQQVKEQKRFRREATEIGKTVAKESVTEVVDSIDRAEADLQALKPEQLQYIYQALNVADGVVPDAMRAMQKEGDPNAREAFKAMQSLMNVLNVTLKDRSGAAVTEPEAQRFFRELGAASALGSLEETLKGLGNLRQGKLSQVEGYLQGRDEGTVEEFFKSSPKYAKYFEEHERYGTDEGKERSALRTEIKDLASTLLEQYPPEKVNAYLESEYGEDAARLGIELPAMSPQRVVTAEDKDMATRARRAQARQGGY